MKVNVILDKEKAKSYDQRVIEAIGNNEDLSSFINFKIFTLIFYETILIIPFLFFFYNDCLNKNSAGIFGNCFFALFFIEEIIRNIILLNKIAKVKIKKGE